MAMIGMAVFGAIEGAVTIGTAVEAAGSIAGAFEAMSAFEVISSVGGIVGGIGALTGNKDLMMIGGVAALAGGIGAFAQGKGWIASDGALADGSSNITAMKNTEAPMGGDVNPTDLRLASGTQGTPGIMPGEESVVTDAISQTSMGQKTSGLMDAKEPGWESATSARQPSPTATSQVGDATRGDWGPDGPAGPGSGKKPGAFGMLSDFSEWANKNKMLAAIGANFIGGFFDSNKRAQTNYYNARTDEINTQIANGKSSPDMNFHLSGKVGFPTTAPTYRPVNVGLYGAKG